MEAIIFHIFSVFHLLTKFCRYVDYKQFCCTF